MEHKKRGSHEGNVTTAPNKSHRKDNTMSQKKQILRHLKTHRGITSLDAFERYGITRLSGRIFDLRQDGYDIISVDREVKNRYGEKCRVAEYRLCR